MNEYVAKITLDLNCQATPVVISAGQFDIGRKIQITLTADGEAYDATGATAVCKGKSGSNYFAVNATVAKNIVTVTTDKAMLSSAGRTVAKIVLTDGTRTYSTQPFVINTHGDYDGDITTSDYYPELLDILSRVLALTESGAVLTDTKLSATSVNPLQNKVLTPIINTINNRLQSAEQNLYRKANATDVSNALKSKADKVDVTNQFSELNDDLVKIQNLITDSNKIPVSFIFGGMSTDQNSEHVAYKKNSRAYSDVTFTSTIAIKFQGISVSVRYFNNEFGLEKSTDWIKQSPLIIETNNYYGFRLVVKNNDDTDINLANLSEQLSVYTEKNSMINFIRGVYGSVAGNSISDIVNKPNRFSLTKIFKITDTMMVVVPKGYSISYRVVDANQNIEKSSDWIGNNFAIHDGKYVFAFKRSDEAKMSYIDVINLSEFNLTKHVDVEYTFSNTGTYENNSLTTYKNSGFISCTIGDTFEYCIRIKGGYAVHLFDKDKNLISQDIHIAATNKSNDFTFSGTYRISKPSVKYIWFDTMNDTHNDYQYYKPSIKMLTDSKSSPNLTIRCAKEKTYNDGTPPKIEWYLLEDVNTEIFYKSKDFSNIERLFCWDNDFSSLDYSFGITKDNDIIAVFKTESLDDLSTHDDSRRKNPFVFDAKNNYACVEVDISDKIKPSGWLSNTGYRVLPDGTILFCEYTRPSVATTNVWRIDSNSDIKNPSNWIVVKSFNLSGDLYSGLKHCHMIMYDHYAGITYLSTGDDDIGSQVWHSKDGGITWTQTRDASEKYCRMLNYVFLKDYIYWSSDTAVENYHYIFRAPRKEDGVIDYDNVTDLQLIPYIDTHVATYGVSYLKDLNLLQLIERVDGTGNATEMPIRGYDLATNSLVTLGVIESVDRVGHNLGFRTEYTEWYPNDGIIKFGFGGKYTWNSALNCNKGLGNVGSYTEKCCVNNLTMKPFKNDNKFGVKFDTIIIN